MRELIAVHDAIRHDLALCKRLAAEAAAGAAPEAIREQLDALRTNGPLWRLRVNCLHYCRFVHAHHGAEDVMLFPAIREADPSLNPVVDRLEADHRQVSLLLDEIEAAAEELGEDGGEAPRARVVVALEGITEVLLTHLEFEEEAIGPTLLEWDRFPFRRAG